MLVKKQKQIFFFKFFLSSVPFSAYKIHEIGFGLRIRHLNGRMFKTKSRNALKRSGYTPVQCNFGGTNSIDHNPRTVVCIGNSKLQVKLQGHFSKKTSCQRIKPVWQGWKPTKISTYKQLEEKSKEAQFGKRYRFPRGHPKHFPHGQG